VCRKLKTNIHLVSLYNVQIRVKTIKKKKIVEFLRILNDNRYLIFLILTEMSDLL